MRVAFYCVNNEQVWQQITTRAKVDPMVYAAIQYPKFVQGPQHGILSEIMMRLATEQNLRYLISMPPRHSKSFCISQVLPAWYLGLHPDRRVIGASYSGGLASEFGTEVRRLMSSPEHRAVFGPEGCASGRGVSGTNFGTATVGGGYRGVGTGGSLTGKGADLLIWDDPVKSKAEANSRTMRKKLQEFFGATFFTRQAPGANVCVMATRWRDDDILSYIETEFADQGWIVINIPAVCEDEADGTNRQIGEALWPAFFPLVRLAEIQTVLKGDWWALYQGRPLSSAGGILKASDLRIIEQISKPELLNRFASWDLGVTAQTTSDYSVGTAWHVLRYESAIEMPRYVRGQWDFVQLCEQIALFSEHVDYTVLEHCHSGLNLQSQLLKDKAEAHEKEAKLQSALENMSRDTEEHLKTSNLLHLARMQRRLKVELFQPRSFGSKYDRFQKSLTHWKSGDVRLVRQSTTDWSVCVDELIKFGVTPNDDFCDSAVQAVLHAEVQKHFEMRRKMLENARARIISKPRNTKSIIH